MECLCMRRDFLSNLGLEQDVIEKIMTQYGSDIEKLKSQNKMLSEDVERLTSELDIAKRESTDSSLKDEKLNELNSQLESLKKQSEESNLQYQNQLRELKLNNAVDKALASARARNPKVVLPLLENFLKTANFDDQGNVIDLDAQIKALSESEETSFLFSNDSKIPQGRTPGVSNNNQQADSLDLSKMSYEQICEVLKNKP